MTIKQAKAALREIGVSLRKTEYGEYRVNFTGGREETACYTNDLDDAVNTGRAMVRHAIAQTANNAATILATL